MSTRKNVLTAFFATVLALGLAACGGGSTKTADELEMERLAAEEMACTDAQGRWNADNNTCTSAAELIAEAAEMACEDAGGRWESDGMCTSAADLEAQRLADEEAAAKMQRAEQQKMDLMKAAAAVDTSDLMTQADIDAAQMAIDALQAALNAAVDVNDADKAMYQSQLASANMVVSSAQDDLDLKNDRADQMTALTNASNALTTALGGLSGKPTQAQIDAAESALADLETAIAAGMDLTDAEKASANTQVATAMGRIAQAKQVLMAQMEADRKAEEEKARMEEAAMATTAAKLYVGIYTPAADANGTAIGAVHAAYNDADNPTGSTADTRIIVTIGDGTAANGEALSEDKDTTVAALHGWEGKGYTASGTDVDGTYEAQVYSHIGEPMEGNKFGSPAADEDYQYTLDAVENTELTMNDTNAGADWEERVASPSFDHSAGVKEFELGNNLQRVVIIGSTYHGVSGTYYCRPAASSTCAVQVAADGFSLGGTADADNAFTAAGGTWTFKPGNREARVTSMLDGYASYGWWLHTAEDGGLTASAFVDRVGATEPASGLDTLNGTATYMGGAAGKYALSSTTGGTNDAGHFTARATLEANFTDNEITGTIDQFVGGNGESRDWSVELKESTIGAGGILNTTGAADGAGAETVWTIGETGAGESGSWTGSLQENGDDGVPGIATGTFYTTYGSAGKMVGAFGANRQ